MAGAGVRVFQPGEVLTAALVNTYLQDQVVCRFDSAQDRDASFGGSGQPNLEEGRICYLDSTNELQYFDGTVWVTISPEAITGVIEAKGDFVVGVGPNTVSRVPVGPNGTIMTADSSTATGIGWTLPSVADGAIIETKIATDAVTTNKIANGAVTSAKIAEGTIVNADISASAAIDLSKIATASAGQVVVYNSTGIPTATTITGDIVISSSGVTSIEPGKIVDADINATAAISYSKLNISGSVSATDLATGAPRAGFRSARNVQAGNYTIALTDLGGLVEIGGTTLTVPTDATANFTVGDRVDIVQTGTSQVTIQGAAGVTVNAFDGGLKLNGQWAAATLIKRATNTWLAVGNLTT